MKIAFMHFYVKFGKHFNVEWIELIIFIAVPFFGYVEQFMKL